MQLLHPREKIVDLKEVVVIRNRILNGGRVVLTSGCFDLLHGGHVEHLFRSKSYGEFLIVGINSDNFVKKLKGKNRPIRNEEDRAFLIAGIGAVDWVVIFDCDYELIQSTRPNIYVASNNSRIRVGDDHKRVQILSELKARIFELPYSDIDSTTDIIKRSAESVG